MSDIEGPTDFGYNVQAPLENRIQPRLQDQGKGDLAIADFRKAIELQPKTFFDMAAQADAKKRVQTLGNQLPCRGAGNAAGQTCL